MKNLFLFLAIFLSIPLSSLAFSDVPTTHRFSEEIKFVQDKGIVGGYTDGTFKPESTINRAEFTKIIISALYTKEEIDACDTAKFSFPDVPKTQWYAKFVCLAKKNGIINGYADGKFLPNGTITLPEAMKILTESYEIPTWQYDYSNGDIREMKAKGLNPNEFWYGSYMNYFIEKIYASEKFPKFPTKNDILVKDSSFVRPNLESLFHDVSRGEMAYFIEKFRKNSTCSVVVSTGEVQRNCKELELFRGRFADPNPSLNFTVPFNKIVVNVNSVGFGFIENKNYYGVEKYFEFYGADYQDSNPEVRSIIFYNAERDTESIKMKKALEFNQPYAGTLGNFDIVILKNGVFLVQKLGGTVKKYIYFIDNTAIEIVAETKDGGDSFFESSVSIQQQMENQKSEWKIYQNNALGFELMIPAYVSIDHELNDQHNRLVIFASNQINIEVNLREGKNTLLSEYSFLDLPISSLSTLGKQEAAVFKTERGYCDGPGCSAPFVTYSTKYGDDFYNLIFRGDAEMSDTEKAILSSFKFTQ